MTDYIWNNQTIAETLYLSSGDSLTIRGYVQRSPSLLSSMFIANGTVDIEIEAGAVLDGKRRASGTNPLGLIQNGPGSVVHGTGTMTGNIHTGLAILNSAEAIVNGPTFTDCFSDYSVSAQGCGVWFYNSPGSILKNSTIDRVGLHGFQAMGCDGFLAEYVQASRVYNAFGGSIYLCEGATVQYCNFQNTHRENFNVMDSADVDFLSSICRNGKSDYGMSYYRTEGGTVEDISISNSGKEALALAAATGCHVNRVTAVNPCQIDYTGHYAGFLVEACDSLPCESNLIENCEIYDTRQFPKVIYSVKEVAYAPQGTNLTRHNLYLNNKCYGFERCPVQLVDSNHSAQHGQDMTEKYVLPSTVSGTYSIASGIGAMVTGEVLDDGEIVIDGELYILED